MELAEPEQGKSYSATLGEHATNPEQPRQVGVPLVLPDRTLTLATDEGRIKAQFEMQVKVWAQEAIRDAAQRGDSEEADLLRAAYITDVAAGAYTWDGKACRATRKDWRGATYMLFLMLRRCHPKITLEEVDEVITDYPKECGVAMRLAEGNFPSSSAARKRKEARLAREKAAKNGSAEAEPTQMMDG